MIKVPLAEVKDSLSDYIKKAAKDEVLITRHGKPAVILIGFASEDDWFDYRDRIAEHLASLKAAGKTILLIEHKPDFPERTGDAFLCLQVGRLHRFDTLAALRAAPVVHDSLDTLSSSTEERARPATSVIILLEKTKKLEMPVNIG